jgi:hypothetical protein
MRSIGPDAVCPGSVFLYLTIGVGGAEGFAATLAELPPHAATKAAATSRTGIETLFILRFLLDSFAVPAARLMSGG